MKITPREKDETPLKMTPFAKNGNLFGWEMVNTLVETWVWHYLNNSGRGSFRSQCLLQVKEFCNNIAHILLSPQYVNLPRI